MKVVVFNQVKNILKKEKEQLEKKEVDFVEIKNFSEKDVAIHAKDAEVLVLPKPVEKKLTKKSLSNLKNLKYILSLVESTSWIDKEYCNEKKIQIFSPKGYASDAVSDYVIKKIMKISNNNLKNKIIGIIGMGLIGSKVAEKAERVGLKVIYKKSRKKVQKYEQVSLEELLKKADFVTLHLKPTKKPIITQKELRMMKKEAVLINTADESLIDTPSLIEFLERGKIRFAILDVYPKEYREKLIRTKRVWLTEHTAFKSRKSFENIKNFWINFIIKN